MKKITLFFALFLTLNLSFAGSIPIPVCFPCEYIAEVKSLPADSTFLGEWNDPLDVGYRHKQISILWVPIWNYEGEYCLTNKARDTYYDILPEEKKFLAAKHDIDFDANPLSFWDKIGGKLVLGLLILLALYGTFGRSKDEPEATEPEPEPEAEA